MLLGDASAVPQSIFVTGTVNGELVLSLHSRRWLHPVQPRSCASQSPNAQRRVRETPLSQRPTGSTQTPAGAGEDRVPRER
ncbi:MAG: hypothetical protein AUI36_00245 [Cyanobacteria bacterium 13_1_40CM_2_61_4]|nr:MAG: hypothetical protein AUI36_00245 [Cyanobacteria bacterium 13_1_40CM_2_61_4]